MSAAIDFDSGLDFGEQTKGTMTPSGYVPSFYMANPHKGADLEAVVTENGRPVEVHGDVLTVGKCPPAFRYAIGPVVDGRAELLDPKTFEEKHKVAIVEYYDGKYDGDVNREHIPTPRAFASKKWDPNMPSRTDPRGQGRVVPLGHGMEVAKPDAPRLLYRQSSDSMVSAEEAERDAGKGQNEILLAELARLREKMEALESREPEPAPEPKAEQPAVAALCGKECKGDFGKQAHERRCKKCAEVRESS